MFSFFKKKKIVSHIKLNGIIGNAGKFKQGIDFSGQEEVINKAFSVKKASSVNIQKLAQQFPQGITEKVYERKDSNGDVSELTIVRIVVSGNKGSEYKKVKSKYGESYFKNGEVIPESMGKYENITIRYYTNPNW